MSRRYCCAVFGHFPMRFAWGFDEEDSGCKRLKFELLQQVMSLRICGISRFMVVCDPGVGLWAAEMANHLKENDAGLELLCVLPHEEQATKWAPYLRERYFEVLKKCTHMTATSVHKTPSAQFRALRVIVDHSDIVLAVYDPDSARGDATDKAMAYACMKQRDIITIHPDTFRVTMNITGK